MNTKDVKVDLDALEPVPWQNIVSAVRAVGEEAAHRGEMFPQTRDEQEEDKCAVRRVAKMIEWYATNGGAVATRLPGWPKQPADELIRRLREAESRLHEVATHCATVEQERDSNLRMFQAAIRDLAAINERLGCDPDEGGAEPILEAIAGLESELAACRRGAPVSDVLAALRDEVKEMQEAAYTYGDYSKDAVRVALDGVIDAIDAARAKEGGAE